MKNDFYRIKRLPPYVLAEVNTMKAAARAEGRDIIDFGMGNPDRPAPAHVVDKLVETVADPRTHRYSTSRGIPGLRRALAAYYARRFGVDLDPETEVIVNIGSKEGVVNLAQAITSPGDVVIAPNPTYPIHTFGFTLAGAAVRHIPLTDEHDYMRELKRAVRHSVPSEYAEHGSMSFAKRLLNEANVAMSPGIGFGEYGEGYLRVALVENEHRTRQAVRNIKAFFRNDRAAGMQDARAAAS